MLDEVCGQALALGGCVLVEGVSDLLGEQVGDFDTDMRFICREGLTEAFLLTWGEPACVRRVKEVGFDRGDHPCVHGDRSCLAGRGGVPHRERRQRA